MSGIPERDASQKAARALQLFEQGLEASMIAERLGVQPRAVGEMIQRAKARREKVGTE